MKVLQIIDRLDIGGAERVFVDLTNLLHTCNNVDVSVLTFDGKGKLLQSLEKEIVIVDFERKNKFNLLTAYKLSKILNDFDLLHVHMRHVYRYIKCVSLIFHIRAKIVFQDHYGEISIDTSIPKFFNSLLRPRYYIGVSKELTDWATNKVKIKQVYLLANIVIKHSSSIVLKEKSGFVIVGNIKPIKNQLFAIQFAMSLNKELTIIGGVHDQAYYKTLLNEINKKNYQNKIHFLHDVSNVQKILPTFELGIMCSLSESGPLVLIEYLAQNLKFVSFNTGEVIAKLNTELSDFVLDTFDKNEWGEKIKIIQKNEYDLESLYYQNFSPNNYINECLKIYKEILSC